MDEDKKKMAAERTREEASKEALIARVDAILGPSGIFVDRQKLAMLGVCHICGLPNAEPGAQFCSAGHGGTNVDEIPELK